VCACAIPGKEVGIWKAVTSSPQLNMTQKTANVFCQVLHGFCLPRPYGDHRRLMDWSWSARRAGERLTSA
jgi:hypothetical protein